MAKNSDIKKYLEDLLDREYDAADGCAVALVRLLSAQGRQQMRRFVSGHARHVRVLLPLVRAVGGKASRSNVVRTRARVLFASGRGDRALLSVLQRCERDLADAFFGPTFHALPTRVQRILETMSLEAACRQAWLDATLDGAPSRAKVVHLQSDPPAC